MKTFLRILVIILALFVLVVIVGLFLPSKIHVERSMVIDAPQKVLFDQVNNLRNWEKWSPWHRIDTLMNIEYSTNNTGTGAYYTWESNHRGVGNGKLTIIDSYPYDSIITEMDFMKHGLASSTYTFKRTGDKTKVTLEYNTDMGVNPLTKYFGLMMDKIVGKDFEKGLKNLDSVATNLPPYSAEIVKLKGFPYVSIRKNCKWEDVSTQMAASYDRLMNYIRSSGAEMTGSPYAVYHKISDGIIDLEMGIPCSKLLQARKDILSGRFPDSNVAKVDFYGFYNKIGDAHGYLQEWIEKKGFTLAGDPMEQYVTDPSAEPDTSKWLTRVYYPVKNF